MTKKTIQDRVEGHYVDFDVIDGRTPAKVIEIMNEYIEKFKGRNVFFNIENNWDDDKELRLYETRLETDQEYAARIAEETRIKALREDKERAEYERLRSKYEKS